MIRSTLITLLFMCFSTQLVAQSLSDTLSQAQQLESQRDFAQLYTLLKPLEGEYGGEPEYDFYLGLAALENKKASEAVFALERALDIRPDFARARAELGRAYFMLGENDNAKAEFETVKADSSTPDGVITTLDKFLAAIDNRFDSSGERLEFFIDTTYGSDDNINAGTDAEDITILFGGFELTAPLSEESQATESTYYSVKPGVRYSTPLQEDLNLYINADISVLEPDQAIYASQSYNVASTIAKLAGASQYQGSLSIQNYEVTEQEFTRDSTSLSGQWVRTLNPKNKINTFLSLADLSYDDGIKDGPVNTLGVNWLNSIGKFANYYGLFLGDESIDDDNQQHQAKEYVGLKIGTRTAIGKNAFYTNITLQENSFKADDPLQGVKRDGTLTSLNLGMDIPILRKLTLSPSLSITENATDNELAIFEYKRNTVSVTAKYEF